MSRLPLVVRRLLMLLLGVCVTECSSQLFVALGVGTVIALTLYGPGLQFFLPVAGAIAGRLHLPVHAV